MQKITTKTNKKGEREGRRQARDREALKCAGYQQCILYPPQAACYVTHLTFHRFLLHHFPSVLLAACDMHMRKISRHVWLNYHLPMASRVDNVKGLFSFFKLCGELKHLKRTGWVANHVREPETVAGHMYRMAMMTFLFGEGDCVITPETATDVPNRGGVGKVDRERCMRMALVHDLAESIVGDIAPHQGIAKTEKYRMEMEAMEHIRTLVPAEVGTELYELWKEYEEGTTAEALLVKDLDAFDMIFQALEYEKSQNRPLELQQFFDSTRERFQNPVVKKWVSELRKERNDSNPSNN